MQFVCFKLTSKSALGGFNGKKALNSVERYNTETRKWNFVNPMAFERCDNLINCFK